jgi:hypothetical protein
VLIINDLHVNDSPVTAIVQRKANNRAVVEFSARAGIEFADD